MQANMGARVDAAVPVDAQGDKLGRLPYSRDNGLPGTFLSVLEIDESGSEREEEGEKKRARRRRKRRMAWMKKKARKRSKTGTKPRKNSLN